MSLVQIQATITGYMGKPCSLFSAYDIESDVLAIAVESDYRRDRRAGCLIIINEPNPSMPREWLFSESDFNDAIRAYYQLKNGVANDGKSSRLSFGDRAMRANPDGAIEQDTMNETGQKYRIADGITCAQIAALATCAYAVKAGGISRTVDHAAQYLRILRRGGIITI